MMSWELGSLAFEWATPLGLAAAASVARRHREVVLFGAASVAVASTVMPPLHGAAHAGVTGHMVQHLVVIVLAAPLIGAALSGVTARRSFPGSSPRCSRARLRWLTARLVRDPRCPTIAGIVHLVVVLSWHHPTLYDAAVAHWFVHGIEHTMLLWSGAWWWWTVFHHSARDTIVAPIVSLFAVATGGAVLGVVMMFAPEPLYSQGDRLDQQLAGALMAGGTGAVSLATLMILVSGAVERLGTPRRRRVPVMRPPTLGMVVVGALTTVGLLLTWSGSAPATTGSSTATATAPVSVALDVSPAVGSLAVGEGLDGGDRSLGQELYRRDCAACHAPSGEGTRLGVPIDEVGTAGIFFALSTGRMPLGDPDDAVTRSEPHYEPEEIMAIVAYTSDFVDGPELPTLDVTGADLARGGEQYRTHCAACHSSTGIGGAQAFGREAPSVLDASPTETAAAIVAGPGGMPAFGSSFTEDEIAGIAAHVELLQDPVTTGVPVSGGRVGEGLLVWVVGVGALVTTIMLIETRS